MLIKNDKVEINLSVDELIHLKIYTATELIQTLDLLIPEALAIGFNQQEEKKEEKK